MDLAVGGNEAGDLLFGIAVDFILIAAVEDHLVPDKGIVVEVKAEVAFARQPGEPYYFMFRVFIDPFVRHGLSAGLQYRLCEEVLTHKQQQE